MPEMSEHDRRTPGPVKRRVLVIGAGIAGITAALELAGLGISVTLIEKEASIGGLAASFCCKAAERCNKCFACVVDKRIMDIKNCPDVTILTQTVLAGLKGDSGAYLAILDNAGRILELEVAALVVAAGIDPYDAALKGEYGYGYLKNVITARDLEVMIREGGDILRPSDGMCPQSIAFFQCVGSRDQAAGNLYCSQVCCAYALRLIRLIRYNYPDITIAFYYMDIQPAGVHFADFLSQCREDSKIRFIRSIPSKVYHAPATDSLRVKFADAGQGDVSEENFDMVILSVGMTLKKEARSITDLLSLGFDEDRFIDDSEAREGIFAAGACTGPKDIEQSATQAKSTALNVYRYLMSSS